MPCKIVCLDSRHANIHNDVTVSQGAGGKADVISYSKQTVMVLSVRTSEFHTYH